MNGVPPGALLAPTLIHRFTSIIEPLDWAQLFASAQPVEMEIGSGDGGFLSRHASAQPSRNFVGVERLLGRLRKLDRRARRAGLQNVRPLRIEAEYLLHYLVPHQSLHAVHIYFPDPWPKARHAKHRLVKAGFPELLHRVLAPSGVVYLRTDHLEYALQMREVFDASPQFAAVETPAALAAIATEFETAFNALGKPTQRAAYQRR